MRHIGATLGGFALLNGQAQFRALCTTYVIPLSELQVLVIGSDGLVPWKFSAGEDEAVVARAMLEAYHSGGLPRMLLAARTAQSSAAATSWEDAPEATAIAFEFSLRR